jgi:hypothetical protein
MPRDHCRRAQGPSTCRAKQLRQTLLLQTTYAAGRKLKAPVVGQFGEVAAVAVADGLVALVALQGGRRAASGATMGILDRTIAPSRMSTRPIGLRADSLRRRRLVTCGRAISESEAVP